METAKFIWTLKKRIIIRFTSTPASIKPHGLNKVLNASYNESNYI